MDAYDTILHTQELVNDTTLLWTEDQHWKDSTTFVPLFVAKLRGTTAAQGLTLPKQMVTKPEGASLSAALIA